MCQVVILSHKSPLENLSLTHRTGQCSKLEPMPPKPLSNNYAWAKPNLRLKMNGWASCCLSEPYPLIHLIGYPHDHCLLSSTKYPAVARQCSLYLMNNATFNCNIELIRLSTVLGSHCTVLYATSLIKPYERRLWGHGGIILCYWQKPIWK